ncbi:hypothetical protein SODALDRAFT_273133, partial [Sodiomyces alkalinus F11]
LAVPPKVIDPTLDALFSSSAGPAKPLPKSRYSGSLASRPQEPVEESDEESDQASDKNDDEDEELPDAEEAEDSEDDSSDNEDAAIEDRLLGPPRKNKDRKRKRDETDDVEGKYLDKLTRSEEAEHQKEKRRRSEAKAAEKEQASQDDNNDQSDDEPIPMHESLVAKPKEKGAKQPDLEIEKANRTVFLSNVATSASTSKSDRRTLLKHLSSVLGESEKIESIRFRSLPFSTLTMPKRAAYITQAVMEATTKSANAYVVYPTPAAARKAVTELNGTVVLDRHVRVDSVAHPTPIDHRRCVFVGNLGFMDDETVLDQTAEGEVKERKRTKVPADVEEGLWRTFGKHAGKVENVRVVRDPKTRVGKGFAYVQFYDINDVESALLLNEKKFPPLLPRTLRVTRAKALHKTALIQQRKSKPAATIKRAKPDGEQKSAAYNPKVTPEQLSMAGRAAKLLGRSGALRGKGGKGGSDMDRSGKRKPGPANGSGVVPKTPEQIIFEGRRASEKDGRPSDLKLGKKVKKGRVAKSKGRTARSSSWKQKGSK